MTTSEKHRGVRFKKERLYQAYANSPKWLHLGYFPSFQEAVEARLAYEIKTFGRVFERRKILVEGDVAKVPIHGKLGVFVDYALVDAEDLCLVSGIYWSMSPGGYANGRCPKLGRNVLMHRLLMVDGARFASHIDHANRNRLDNRRANLRLCTRSENAANRSFVGNKTGYKGVTKLKSGRFQAVIAFEGVSRSLGAFDSAELAAEAYDRAAAIYHGEFASPNSQIAAHAIDRAQERISRGQA